ncbi:hypothetical protein F9L16_09445 [Agarivorans sp. B2Z047]|uniref:Lipoprotein n=1 Tax=Agarivorans albus MKT 106 TaxID=1331007 RepID=R9PP85_AGAAL|nr:MULTISPECIES: hypothetical protein [Agarivorans]MPW29222.1 hypothetical protein [Agarivorans sp. B2Z047]UQN41775.1 hypothetical protein LQZ07_18655 [Agarivorans sp. B2Z047]GAD03164.1 hypothetical protein AALB_3244 [Agarivorans albus MKT 106]
MLLRLIFAVVVLSLTACSTIKTKPLDANESLSLADKSLVYTRYSALPDFAAQTAANVQFGLLGLASAISSGNAMIVNNQIEDPALDIARELASGLSDSYKVKVVDDESKSVTIPELPNIIELYSDYDYILDVRTLSWSSIYYTSDWDNYRVSYQVHARLIDREKGIVIAEEACNNMPEYADTEQGPSYVELESGEGLKRELARSVEFCVEHIRNMARLRDETNANSVKATAAEGQTNTKTL